MVSSLADIPSKLERFASAVSGSTLVLVQGCLALFVLTLSASPGAGGTALFLPLPAAMDDGSSIAWAQENGATVLGQGPYRGSLVLRLADASPTQAADGRLAIGAGALLIAIPEAWCGSASPDRSSLD